MSTAVLEQEASVAVESKEAGPKTWRFYAPRSHSSSEPARITDALAALQPAEAKDVAEMSGLDLKRVQVHFDYWMKKEHRNTNIGRCLQMTKSGEGKDAVVLYHFEV